jgi:predicted dehydrogenase
MLRIAVIGAGHLGKIHIRCLQALKDIYQVVGFFDNNPNTSAAVAAEFGLPAYTDADALIAAVDVVDIVTPTSFHFDWAARAIAAGKHIFVEKPISHNLETARELCRLAKVAGIKAQVGHVERFNPALLALEPLNADWSPKFLEIHRLATFNPRGTDVSVVEDLMIHDLDIMLKFVNSPVKSVSATGVAIISQYADIANAHIEFQSGAVANITASRISLKAMRKFRFFQSDAYISMDFLNKTTELVRLFDAPNADTMTELDTFSGKKYLQIAQPEAPANNAIQTELAYFAQAISENTPSRVPLEDGLAALELAHLILERIKEKEG